jgi:DNA repair exonuclease SbcCD ATPase subunit
MADDTLKLDSELRRHMRETASLVQNDLALFEKEAEGRRDTIAAEFNAAVDAFKLEMAGIEREVQSLKNAAAENVHANLQIFEDDFAKGLARRGEELEQRLENWQKTLEKKMLALTDEAGRDRRDMENTYSEELRRRLTEQNDNILLEIEKFTNETKAFEEGIRGQMTETDETLAAFRKTLDQNLEEVRKSAENSIKAESGRYALSAGEIFKQHQRDLEAKFQEIAKRVEGRNNAVSERIDGFRKEIDEWKTGYTAQLRSMDATVEDARRKALEMADYSDKQLGAVRAAINDLRDQTEAHRNEVFSRTAEHAKNLEAEIDEVDRRVREFSDQTKLFDRADELKRELERKIEDLQADMDRLEQMRDETSELEDKITRIKHLEDDVNAKMTRFLSEKYRIEQMENDFNRLITTSKSVEEKLEQVITSDDILQTLQLNIRKLESALTDTEERFERLERKNEALEVTTTGIDRNFKSLEETENAVETVGGKIKEVSQNFESLRNAIDILAGENQKAQDTVEKLSILEGALEDIENRITEIQKAREWLAGTETRMEELNREAQKQVKLMGALLKEEGGKGKTPVSEREKNTTSSAVRENVIRLARQGWSNQEIAKVMKISVGQVELILEIGLTERD